MQSENINELALALSKAQGEMSPALKDTANPFFKSKYADLSSCWNACRDVLSKHGLAVIQTGEERDGKFILVTTLCHGSGQYIKSSMPVVQDKPGIQPMGAALTYLRRYSLSAIIGLCQEDDDANSATNRPAAKIEPQLILPVQLEILETALAPLSEYKTKLLDYLRKAHAIYSLNEIPASMFDNIMSEAKRQAESIKHKEKEVVNA